MSRFVTMNKSAFPQGSSNKTLALVLKIIKLMLFTVAQYFNYSRRELKTFSCDLMPTE